jgi:RNA polymerase sigma-70 factor (ECF subfamily)
MPVTQAHAARPQTDVLAVHRPYLFRYALSRLRQRGAAEDVVQETLLAAVEGQGRFRGDSALLTWLTGILKHKIIDWERREARNPARTSSAPRDDDQSELDEHPDELFDADGNWLNPPSAWPRPEQAFENARFWETFEGCLASLPPASARAFYLREFEGMDTGEICDALGISESNCWVMLHRARLALRDKLEERWFGKTPARPARDGAMPAQSQRGKPSPRGSTGMSLAMS